jgi:hypothetical protein
MISHFPCGSEHALASSVTCNATIFKTGLIPRAIMSGGRSEGEKKQQIAEPFERPVKIEKQGQ